MSLHDETQSDKQRNKDVSGWVWTILNWKPKVKGTFSFDTKLKFVNKF